MYVRFAAFAATLLLAASVLTGVPPVHGQAATDSAAVGASASTIKPARVTTKLIWTAHFNDEEVGWVRSTQSGAVVVGTEDGLFGLDDSSGAVLWKKVDLREPENIDVDVLPEPPFGLLRLEKGQRGKVVRILIDLTTGKEMWNSTDVGLVDVWHQAFAPTRGLLIMSGKLADGDPDKVVVAVDVQTGKRAWVLEAGKKEAEHFFSEILTLLDTDSSMVAAGERLTRYNLRNGKRIWQSPELKMATPKRCAMSPPGVNTTPQATQSRPLAATAPPRLSRDGRMIFAAYGKGVAAYDMKTGAPLWKEVAGLCGQCVQMRETAQGLLVHTKDQVRNDELILLDSATGNLLWQYPPDKGMGSVLKTVMSGAGSGSLEITNPILRDNTSYFMSGSSMKKEIQQLNVATGQWSTFAKVSLSETYTAAEQLIATRDGFLVIGLQDLQWIDQAGKPIRRQQYQAPDDVGLGLLMMGGIKLARSMGTVEIGDLAIKYTGGYEPALERMDREYHATSAMADFVFMLAGNDPDVHGIALLGIDRNTGEILTKIPAGKDLRFVVNLMRSRAFIVEDDELRCYVCAR